MLVAARVRARLGLPQFDLLLEYIKRMFCGEDCLSLVSKQYYLLMVTTSFIIIGEKKLDFLLKA